MDTVGDVQQLLSQVDAINRKYRDAQRDPRYQFNVFTILRQADDEIGLHSRFLAELLDPRGQHLQGPLFLSLFLDQVGIGDLDLQTATVKREYRGIDLLVTDTRRAVIIENKINAADQPRQLERYYRTMVNDGYRDIVVIYLTLYGDRPSHQSIGGLDGNLIQCISYAHDIHSWLGDCIRQTVHHPALSDVLFQYRRVVERLTGQTLSKEYTMAIRDLLLDEKNIELATHISQALVEARVEIQWRFWQELEQRLRDAGFAKSCLPGCHHRLWECTGDVRHEAG